jgi:hypothetical protein
MLILMVEAVNNLEDLGFAKGAIFEAIVSTYCLDGQPTAAPMGVMTMNMQHVIVKPYCSTLTFKNLYFQRDAVLNLTSNPELYYRTVFKEVNPNGRVPLEWFGKAEIVNAPRVLSADAFVEVSVVDIKLLGERAEFLCGVKLVRCSRVLPKAYCRATFATIEAIIHATRVKAFLNKGEYEKAERLIELIRHYSAVVNRVAPNSKCSEILADLIRQVNLWRRENNEGSCENSF